jgi:predicted esterase YcpF (UPF0227 family)
MIPVLYFHGFASSPGSAKITALRPLLEPHAIELITPDLNVPSFEELDFEAVIEHAAEVGRATPPLALVGSSLGALVALAVSHRGLALPMVLIAPALGVARRWSERVPEGEEVEVFNYAREGTVAIHRRFFDQMAVLDVDLIPPPSRVTAIMGREDETVPFEMVEETWQRWEASGQLVPGSRFIPVAGGDHSLAGHIELIRDAIVEAVR